MKTKKGNLLIVLASAALLFYLVLGQENPGRVWGLLQRMNLLWIAAALALMVLYWLLESGVLHLALRRFHPKQRFGDTVQTSMIGQFFNCVTPFSSGGQPMQAYHLAKTGVSLGSASCALLLKFVVYQFVLTLYSALTLLFFFGEFSSQIQGLGLLVLAGFGINLGVIAGLLCLCFFHRGTARFVGWMVELLARVRLVKNPQQTHRYLAGELEQFHRGFEVMARNRGLILRMALLTGVQLTGYLLIPFCIFQAFGLGQVSVLRMVSAEAFVLNVTSFVPLPGAAGGAELSFHSMFGLFFPKTHLALGILLWRMFTFYLPILVGFGFTLLFTRSLRRQRLPGQAGRKDAPNLPQTLAQKVPSPPSLPKMRGTPEA